jgi:hypothetical protein
MSAISINISPLHGFQRSRHCVALVRPCCPMCGRSLTVSDLPRAPIVYGAAARSSGDNLGHSPVFYSSIDRRSEDLSHIERRSRQTNYARDQRVHGATCRNSFSMQTISNGRKIKWLEVYRERTAFHK